MANRTFSALTQVVSEATGDPGTTGRGPYLAGLALNEAIDESNAFVDAWFLLALANFSLVSGQRAYTLSTSLPNFTTLVSMVLLNSTATRRERFILEIPLDDMFRAGYETTDLTGSPSYCTIDPFQDRLIIDRDPGPSYNGRTVRALYYRRLSRMSISTSTLGVDDQAENWIVQDALWRARRYAGLDDWPLWKKHADEIRKRLFAKPQAVDLASLGLL